ncbi:MAG: hypothetical protein ACJ72H_28580 [Candidatus Sulfotelmatobacter sp.]
MSKRPRQTVQENIAARIERNKQRAADAVREFLSKDAPTREREKEAA